MPDEINVPVFKTLEDFHSWASNLSDKEIQSWRTKDWLKVFEKIDAYVESPGFDKIYRESVPKLIGDKVLIGTVEDFMKNSAIGKKMVFVKSSEKTRDLLGNLYANFRFEPEQIEIIRKLGQKAGEQLAKVSGLDLASVAVKSNFGRQEAVQKIINWANSITMWQTNYPLKDVTYSSYFKTKVDDTLDPIQGGYAVANPDGTNSLVISSLNAGDNSVTFGFHEGAHLHMQNKGYGQRRALSVLGVRAVDDFSEDFYKLMEKNVDYYVSPRNNEEYQKLEVRLSTTYDKKTVKRILRKDFNRYHHQPVEKYSGIYGIEAERAFRRETGLYSERTAMAVADKVAKMFGRPETARYVNGDIELLYKPEEVTEGLITSEQVAKIMKTKFEDADESLLKKINIQWTSDGEVKICVKNNAHAYPMQSVVKGSEESAVEAAEKTVAEPVEHATKKTVERATTKTAMMTQVKTAAKTEMSSLAAVNRVYDKMFGWLKETGKRIRKSLTESPEEIERRQRKQQMTENKARAKANERLTIQRAQEKFKREQERKKKLLKREIRIRSFEDFLLIQKELRENMQKTGTDECKVAQQICEDIIKMRRDNEEFREKYDARQQKESKQIAERAKVERRKQGNKSNNTVPPTRGGGYTI